MLPTTMSFFTIALDIPHQHHTDKATMLSRALTPTMRAASLLRARVAAPVIGSVRGYADDAHGPKKQPLHKEEWLEVARKYVLASRL